jgi:hypothetical protein
MPLLAKFSFTGKVEVFDMNGDPVRDFPRPAPAGMTAEKVIDRYLTVCGGTKAIGNLKDVRITSRANLQGMPVALTQWYARPDQYASEMKSGSMVLERTVHSGGRAVSRSPMGVKELADTDLNDVKQNAYPFPEMKYAEFHHVLKLQGMQDVYGRACYRVLVEPENATTFIEYYDAETGFKLRRVDQRRGEEGTEAVTTDYGDYRPVDGVLFPFQVKQDVGIQVEFTVLEIKVNKGVDAAVFSTDK